MVRTEESHLVLSYFEHLYSLEFLFLYSQVKVKEYLLKVLLISTLDNRVIQHLYVSCHKCPDMIGNGFDSGSLLWISGDW